MERKLYKQLLEWKNSKLRKPLILQGARQVGKTWLMKHFGQNEYQKCIYISCDNNPLVKNLFNDYDIKRILYAIQSISHILPEENNTLIIFDEIQEVSKGLSVLKYFKENAPNYHVMVAGSLLGITMHSAENFPVGMVDILTLYPFDFQEFLLSQNQKELSEMIGGNDKEILKIFKPKFEEYLRLYYFIGGMPEVINAFNQTQDLSVIPKIQANILNAYQKDISKHAPQNQVLRIKMVLTQL